MGIIVWLTIVIIFHGEGPIALVDDQVDSIQNCIQESQKALDKASIIYSDKTFEFQTSCSIVKPGQTPVKERQ